MHPLAIPSVARGGISPPLYIVNMSCIIQPLFLFKHYSQLPAKWKNGQQITEQVCVSEEFPTNQQGS